MRRLAGMAMAAGLWAAGAQGASANLPARELAWQATGARAIDLQLAGPASGAVIDAAFSSDGARLFALTARGDLWATSDLGETWVPVAGGAEAFRQASGPRDSSGADPAATSLPEPQAIIQQHPYDARYTFALGRDLYRSTDQGRSWVNLTADGAGSVIGPSQKAIAFSPLDPNLIVVANSRGLWRSVDGGLSWSDLNHDFPNLPEMKIRQLSDGGGLRVFLRGIGPAELNASSAWEPARDPRAESWLQALAALPPGDQQRRSAWPLEAPPGWALSYRVWRNGAPLTTDLTACATTSCDDPSRHYISAFAAGSDSQPSLYLGTSDGHLWVSSDGGQTWRAAMQGFAAGGAPVNGVWVSPQDSRVALAVAGGRGAASGHVFRTTNGGAFWDDLTANLPDAPVRAVAANAETGSIYLGSEAGVFYTRADLRNPGPATPWTELTGNFPKAPIEDVRLNPVTGNLYIAVAGYGVFGTTVPDITDSLKVLNAADLTARAAAPGGLLTVIGAPVRAARAANLTAPVLASGPSDSQIQVPFEATGPVLDLALETRRGSTRVGIPLEAVSPAIFLDGDSTPLVLDAASGVLLDSTRPARAGSEILILATGLGRVRPDWPTGVAAPLENPPATIAPVSAYLDGAPLKVISSTLAAGYIGVYMVRAGLPSILNSGTAELTIASGDKTSNKVRIFVDPGQ
ncbi:MAG TPA: hypothetical protein VEU62_16185 [Bryobacterales bacterium]|nr:hypothetical protein [Bryobacterales bacterium]